MAYRLNVDMWDWVNPETQKVLRLRRGDEVPAEVLETAEDKEAFFAGPRPVLLRDEDVRETGAPTEAATVSRGTPIKSSEDKK